MKLEKAALVIIDVQAGAQFLNRHVYHADADYFTTVVQHNQQLVANFEHRNWPIFIVTVHPKVFPAFVNQRFAKSLLMTAGLKHVHYVAKTSPSAFSQPTFMTKLHELGVEKLIMTGFTTNNGVAKTVADAEINGFDTTVVTDATVAKSAAVQAQILPQFTELATTAEILAAPRNN
ncbi:cysteine hydrolase family protein [Lactiplantibacillus fabifermentans]|uniref:Isochorismatase-like domain-containing protein n=2 Tax=Lactiplantibacillus fabifermentans TaxID=483011 RepID=A0A0R2NGX2_9LACO|nr:isochorismatase family protein [Lactiplantibacillus fabifermentans]ETY75434.1 hypothetical protein LFAB_02145 [Lactiplantibacillus fabifermentans T30PCM01]KRO25045.1 hypothetical protein DY78_GL001400 [Lactiplantibacillus fabifermentans DSM 21115]